MSESKESKRTSIAAAPSAAASQGLEAQPEDAESRKANRNFLLWWIGLPLLVMIAVVLLRGRV